jgi:hypothetical protein
LDRPTLGGPAAKIAEALGKPLMPWQRHVLDVALEVDPKTDRLVYREVRLTVPRQQGKTQLILTVAVHRAIAFGVRQNIVYTAQTRKDARKKWEDEHVAELTKKDSVFKDMLRVRKSNGDEAIKWNNGSIHSIDAVTEQSGHGPTIDLGFIDEAFAQVDNRTEQAMKPAMMTREQPQLWIVSTAGTSRSVYLKDKVDDGRERALAGLTEGGICYIEWSADEEADPLDEETWWSCMPAVGYTVPREAIRSDFESMRVKRLGEFLRAYLNRWVNTPTDPSPIDPDVWATRAADQDLVQLEDPVTFGFDINPERTSAAISVYGGTVRPVHEDGRPDRVGYGEIVEEREGTEWLLDRLLELVDDWAPAAVAVDASGPAGSLIPALVAAGVPLKLLTAREMAQAAGGLYDDVQNDLFTHGGQEPLDAAIAGASKLAQGDGAWKFGRKGSAVNISSLVALAAARQAAQVTEDEGSDEDVSVWDTSDESLELCDACGDKPHEDPDGEFDYLCKDCREGGD